MTDTHEQETAGSFAEPDEMIVAILGKYYVHEDFAAIDHNIFLARQLHRAIFDTPGLASFCAHTHTAHFEVMTRCGEGKFQRVDRLIVRSVCKAAILVPNWRTSLGTINEIVMCNELGIPVFEEPESLLRYRDGATIREMRDRIEHATMPDGSDRHVAITRGANRTAPPLTAEELRNYNGGGLEALLSKR